MLMKCHCNFPQKEIATAKFYRCFIFRLLSSIYIFRNKEVRCSIQKCSFCQQVPYSSLPRINSFQCKYSSYSTPETRSYLEFMAIKKKKKKYADLVLKQRQITNYCGVWFNMLHGTIFSFWCNSLCFVLFYERWEIDKQCNGIVGLLSCRVSNSTGPFTHPTVSLVWGSTAAWVCLVRLPFEKKTSQRGRNLI